MKTKTKNKIKNTKRTEKIVKDMLKKIGSPKDTIYSQIIAPTNKEIKKIKEGLDRAISGNREVKAYQEGKDKVRDDIMFAIKHSKNYKDLESNLLEIMERNK